MFIRVGYDIVFDLPAAIPMMALLHTHPEVTPLLRQPDILRTEPELPVHEFLDGFGNRCARLYAPPGRLRLTCDTVVEDDGLPNPVCPEARQHPVEDLPDECLPFLLASRYCEVDRLGDVAWELFGGIAPGWGRVQAICDWVHNHVMFGYEHARPTKTAHDVYTEGNGVCRDFQHLAITFCRSMNIPARYATGYLGDHGVPVSPGAMDFSAWFEAYLGGQWWTWDARYNVPRIGHVLMARGRDATDCALTTSFGTATLEKFVVWSDRVEGY
jgi:transglutaminase-like putative cysteine protease